MDKINIDKIINNGLNEIINEKNDIKFDNSQCLINSKFKKILLKELGYCKECSKQCFKDKIKIP